MSRSRITINGVTSSYVEVPINTVVTITNDGDGSESLIAWTCLTGSQPSGSHNLFSAPTGSSITLTPTKEGSYLIHNMINANASLTSSAIIAVKHITSNLRAPAAGEKTEESGTFGWAYRTHDLFNLTNDLYADTGRIIGTTAESIEVGHLVRPSGVMTLKDGLVGEQEIMIFTSIAAEATSSFQSSVYLVDSSLTGTHTTITSGTLFRARLYGNYGPLTGTTTTGNYVWARSDGVISTILDTVDRKLGTVTAAEASNYWIHFDGTSDLRTDTAVGINAIQVTGSTVASGVTTLGLSGSGGIVISTTAVGATTTIDISGSDGRNLFDVKRYGALGNNSANDTLAIQACIAAANGGTDGDIYFPPGWYIITGSLLFSGSYARVRGAGRRVTSLVWSPTAWAPYYTPLLKLETANTVTISTAASVEDMTLIGQNGANATPTVAIELVDKGDAEIKSVEIINWGSVITSSIGMLIRGHETLRVKDTYTLADRPLVISTGSVGGLNYADHFHFQDNQWIGMSGRQHPLIEIEGPCVVNNLTFNGSQAWVAGTHGLYWPSTLVGNQTNIILEGIRSEQGVNTGDPFYTFYGKFPGSSRTISMNACTLDSTRGGVYISGSYDVSIRASNFQQINHIAIETHNIQRLLFDNVTWPESYMSATGTLEGMTQKYALRRDNTNLLPSTAMFVTSSTKDVDTSTFRSLHVTNEFRLGKVNSGAGNILTARNGNILAVTDCSAARNVTVATADINLTGSIWTVKDESGACSTTNTITIIPASGLIDGKANVVLTQPYGFASFYSDGTNLFSTAMTGTQVQSTIYGIYNVKDYGATGNGSDDDTAAIQLTVNAAPNGGTVLFPAGSYLITDTIRISGSYLAIEGISNGSVSINFKPVDGINNKACFKFGAAAEAISNSIRNLRFYSSSNISAVMNVEKHAVIADKQSNFLAENLFINGWRGTSSSVGVYIQGSNTTTVKNSYINADRPIVIGSGSDSVYQTCQSVNLNNLFLIVNNLNSNNLTASCVTVEDKMTLYDFVVDGYQRWMFGKHGLYFQSNGGGTGGATYNMAINNVYRTNAATDTGYMIYLDNSTQIINPKISDCFCDDTANGILIVSAQQASIKNTTCYVGYKKALYTDNTVTDLLLEGFGTQATNSASMGGLTKRWAMYANSETIAIPSNAFYTSNATLYDYTLKDIFIDQRFRLARTVSGAGNISTARGPSILAVTDTAAGRFVTINSGDMNTTASGSIFIIKDETGGAAANPITIVPGTGTIDGNANITINSNYGYVSVYTVENNLFIWSHSGTSIG